MLKTTQVLQTQPTSPTPRSYQRILVAVDYFDSTPEIFNQALEMAKSEGGRLMVFHCLQGEISPNPHRPLYAGLYGATYSPEMVELEEKLLEEATEVFRSWLYGFSQQAKAVGVTAEVEYRAGDADKEICALAKEWGADLIIVGRSGKKGLSELILGSVSNYVVHHAPCAVLVMQH